MLDLFRRFGRDQGGAITVDWVVLTAALVGLGLALAMNVTGAANGAANELSTAIAARNVDN